MAQRCAAGTDLGFTRDRRSYAQVGQARLAWIVTICGGPGSAMHRSTSLRAAPRPGRDSVGRVRSLIHFSNSPSRSRGAFLHPGFATLLHSPQTRGGRSAEKRSGACKAPVRHAMTRHARRLRGALRPMTQQYTGGNNVTISTPDDGSVPIVSQTEIEPIKTALSLMFALVTATALTEPPPVSSNAERLVEVDRLRWMDARSPH